MENRRDVRTEVNQEAFERMTGFDPVLEAIKPAIDVVPGMTRSTILTSGPPMPWGRYAGGQRFGVVGGALYEGLASTPEEAEAKIDAGEIRVEACSTCGCVGSLAGIYTASMPVFVVRDAVSGSVSYCNFYEGHQPKRLNYGVYDDDVRRQLDMLRADIAPVLAAAVEASGGIRLKPIMTRALHMGDELHSRNTAASLLFSRELFPALLEASPANVGNIRPVLDMVTQDNYFFLRLSMAAAKTAGYAAQGVAGSSIVTAMAFNCCEFGIQVSGLGDQWFVGPLPEVEAQLFEGHTSDEITWMGGESIIAETVGLGGFAQAAAFPLQRYQGGSPQKMVEANLEMYRITHGEHPEFRIPFLSFRGTPTGIDIFKVLETGITPVMDIGIAGKGGGQIGAGTVRANIGCFEAAVSAFQAQH